MLYLQPIRPDKFLLSSSWFGLFRRKKIFMQSDITLPLFYSDLMDFYSQQPKFGLKAKWDCRISALTAATILRVNQDAPTDVKIALYLILGEVIRMEIKALIFLNHNPEPLVIALDEFRRHLINCDKSDRAI